MSEEKLKLSTSYSTKKCEYVCVCVHINTDDLGNRSNDFVKIYRIELFWATNRNRLVNNLGIPVFSPNALKIWSLNFVLALIHAFRNMKPFTFLEISSKIPTCKKSHVYVTNITLFPIYNIHFIFLSLFSINQTGRYWPNWSKSS